MGTKHYTKKALTLDQQVNFLAEQGLIIENFDVARQVLSVIGYYRLSGYMLPFKQSHNTHTSRSFKAGITFDQIWQLYQFDRELKLLVTDAIEKIEVAFRASIINETAISFSPFWYTEQQYFRSITSHENLMRNINKIIKDKQEVFIEHYYSVYKEPSYPPIWMIIETLSFGVCSKLFSNLKHVGDKKKIAAIFNRAPTIIDSWLETLVYTRNLCAHHSRFWNRWFVAAPIIPKHDQYHDELNRFNRRFIAVAYVISKLLEEVAPKSHWKEKLFDVFKKYGSYPGIEMGFKNDWENDSFWE